MLLRGKDSFDPKFIKIIDKLDLQTEKLTSLVQQLMDVSQMENGSLAYSLENVPFNAFVSEVVDLLCQAHNSHTISLTLNEDAVIKIDRLRMEQVITNLLGNAAKYSPTGTSIGVECSMKDGMALVSVTDNGLGMSKEVLGSIFEKFYRDKNVLATHPGLGMGLYITSKIVIDHGGKIWAESSEGAGSTFFFSIPCN
ncbi:MAG: HAMP domain-containing histidine kinase [Flavobacterium sp.]|nr:MAG: HAMP domain-containing histidine kinase [Flavobacterium sp.]